MATSLAPGQKVTVYGELSPENAHQGRRVRLGNTMLVRGVPSPSQALQANQQLAKLLTDASPGPDAGVVRDRGDGSSVVETSMEGRLKSDWTGDLPGLQGAVLGQSQSGLVAQGFAASAVEPSYLGDLEGLSRTITYNPVYTSNDPDINPDGSLNWGSIVAGGAAEGLGNLGEAAGGAVAAAGEAVGAAVRGVGEGLGLGGTLFLVLVLLAVVAVVAWIYLRGLPAPAAGGGA